METFEQARTSEQVCEVAFNYSVPWMWPALMSCNERIVLLQDRVCSPRSRCCSIMCVLRALVRQQRQRWLAPPYAAPLFFYDLHVPNVKLSYFVDLLF